MILPLPPLKFFVTPLPALVVGEESLVIGFALLPPTLEMLPPSLNTVIILDCKTNGNYWQETKILIFLANVYPNF